MEPLHALYVQLAPILPIHPTSQPPSPSLTLHYHTTVPPTMASSGRSGSLGESLLSNFSVSSSSQAVSDGYSAYDYKQVSPYTHADLKDCEYSEVDQLLAVFLEYCRATNPPTNPSTARTPQSAGSSQNPSPSSSPTVTEGPSVTNDPTPAPNPEDITFPLISRELLNSCLQKVTGICSDSEIWEYIQTYQATPKERGRYGPFVKFANRVLELLKTLDLPELRGVSPLDILFQTNEGKRIKGKGGSLREPDIVIVSLAGAKRARKGFEGGWKECAESPWPQESRGAYDWSDLLISGEMKWCSLTLDFQRPTACGIDLQRSIECLPIRKDDARFSSIISGFSAPQKGDTPSTPISSVPTPSGSASEYTPPSVETDNSREASSTSNKHKRPAEDPDEVDPEERAPKRTRVAKKNPAINDHIIDAVLKSGINGAEMLRSSLGRANAFGMIIIDATIWIWRFDRQGAIQSTGINFIEDLPRLMVLLLAMQRFNLSDWGFNEQLDPTICLRHSSATPPNPQPVELEFDGENQKFKIRFTLGEKAPLHDVLHEVFSLKGKSTTVFKVTSDLKNNESGLVAKLYWPNRDRPNEADIIKHAHEDADLANHLPYVFGSRDLDPIGTRRIREELGIAARSPRLPRLLRIAIFEELLPITILTGDNLVFAWLECIRCHYRLWQRHIRHLDLSLANLMLRGRDVVEPKYFGVLNDWDLGDEEENRTESRKDLTKTILFTSLDLLRDRLPGESFIQLYPHDLESFAWILVWVFLAIREGKTSPGAKVTGWRTSDPNVSDKERQTFAFTPWKFTPQEEWSSYWQMAENIAAWLSSRIKKPDLNAPPENDLELLRSFLDAVGSGYIGRKPDLPKIEGL